MKTNNIELINTFAAKVLAGETDFVLGGNSFVSAKHGCARYYYASWKDWNSEPSYDSGYALRAVYAEDTDRMIYVMDYFPFALSGDERDGIDRHIVELSSIKSEINSHISDCYEREYNSVSPTMTDQFEKEKDGIIREIRRYMIAKKPFFKKELPEFTYRKILETLCEGETFYYAADKFVKDNIDVVDYNKSRSVYTCSLMNAENACAETWEVVLGRSLCDLDAKTVSVEFEYNGKTASGKLKPESVLYYTLEKYSIDYFNFSTSTDGKRVYKELGLEEKHGVLYASHIKSISYRGKKIYKPIESAATFIA